MGVAAAGDAPPPDAAPVGLSPAGAPSSGSSAGDSSPGGSPGAGRPVGHVPWWREALTPPALAFQFLTAVPLPLAVPAQSHHLGRALALFPLVGAALGLALAGLDRMLRLALPISVATVLLLLAITLLTGGLHLDGLMDTCDGLFGGRTAERRLEIMRDSRVGSFGVLGGALQLLLKYVTLVALPAEMRGPSLVGALLAARWAMAGAIWGFPYARPRGLGASFKAGVSLPGVAGATILALAGMWLALGWLGLALLVLAAGVTLAAGLFITRRLGGLTGDGYGAIGEIVESALLIALVALLGKGPRG